MERRLSSARIIACLTAGAASVAILFLIPPTSVPVIFFFQGLIAIIVFSLLSITLTAKISLISSVMVFSLLTLFVFDAASIINIGLVVLIGIILVTFFN